MAYLKINNIHDNSEPRLDSGVDYNVVAACFEGSSRLHQNLARQEGII
jgi:hypothetical protein